MTNQAGLSSVLSRFDFTILDWLQKHTIAHSVPLLQFISYTTTIVSISFTILVLILYFITRSKPLLKKFLALTVVLIVVLLTSLGLKTAITRERPFVTHPYIEKLSEAGSSSFPSGHTLEAFAMAAAVLLLFPGKKTAIPAYAWAVAVAYSRMALGVHYPSDVLGGIIIGTIVGSCVSWIFKKFLLEDK